MKISSYKVAGGGMKWRVDMRIAGVRIREDDFNTKKAVEQFVVEFKEKARRRRYGLDETVPQVLLSELGKAYLANLGTKTQILRRQRVVIEKFLSLFPVGPLAAEVTSTDYSRFLA